MIKLEKYKNHSIMKRGDNYIIYWFRGKEYFRYEVTESLVEKSKKSDKDALEVMFYLENKRWPKQGELENYNKTDVKEYIGDGFIIYEENGKYEIEIEKDYGEPACYPITKELKEKALKSSRDGYEVVIYAETGRWPLKDQGEVDREFLREYPEFILKNPELNKELFSEEEFNHLVALGKERKKQKEQEKKENK